MKPKRSRKVARVPEDVRLGRSILPAGQARAGAFVAVDISNHSESDQRRMVRSGERRTIRRLTRVELMHKAGTISEPVPGMRLSMSSGFKRWAALRTMAVLEAAALALGIYWPATRRRARRERISIMRARRFRCGWSGHSRPLR
jgi:hypothetical protein